MGKPGTTRKPAPRHNPYGTQRPPIPMDRTVSREGPSEPSERPLEPEKERPETTRGHIMQRHKREVRLLNQECTQYQERMSRLSNRDVEQRQEKKELKKYVAGLRDALAKRHGEELASFDGQEMQKATKEVGKVLKPAADAIKEAELMNMFAHLTN